MKRILVACVAALALAAVTEQQALAGGGAGVTFGIGLDMTLRGRCWNNNCCPQGGACPTPNYYFGYPPPYAAAPGYAPQGYPPHGYAAAPAPVAPVAPKAAPAAQPTTQQIGYYQDYSGMGYAGYNYGQNYGYTGYGYGYGYAPSYWYGY